jgi:hypothetical protein
MIKNSFIIVCLLVLFFSCKKDAAIILPAINSPNNMATGQDTMLPLAVGNYWIYQRSDNDSLSNISLQNSFDSVYIEKDTFIFGEQYFKFSHSNSTFFNFYYFFPNFYGSVFIRDSSGFLVTSNHKILLDNVHMHDTIERNVHSNYDYSCTVPDNFTQKQFLIGNYSGISMNCIYIRNHPQMMALDTFCTQMFVDKIGIVNSYYSYFGCLKNCRYNHQLIRYYLN